MRSARCIWFGMDELTAAQKPGAVEAAVRARIVTSDPTVVDAIVATERRKLDHLYETAHTGPIRDVRCPGAETGMGRRAC